MDSFRSSHLFQPYLLTGERVRWSGQPKQGLAAGNRDIFLIPFSLLWGGFAIFWNAMVWFPPGNTSTGESPDLFLKLWGLPFLIVGVYLIIGRFLYDSAVRKRLFYAVTDQRVLILRGSKITSLDIDRLPRLELTEHRDGTGTLAFEASNLGSSAGTNGWSWWLPSVSGSQFFRVQNPRNIYRLIRNRDSLAQ